MHRILSHGNRLWSKASAGPIGRFLGSPGADLIFLAILLGLLCWPSREWIPRAVAVPSGDEATHLLAYLTFQEHFLRAGSLSDWLEPVLSWRDHNAYPPLVYLLVGLWGAAWGGLDIAGLAHANTAWMVLTVVATFLLGRNLFGGNPGRLIGATAAALVAFTPITLTQLPTLLLDLPATATFMLALALLATNPSMKSRPGALLVGAAVAGVALTKWLTILSLAPALAYVVLRVLREAPRAERAGLVAGLTVLVLILATAASLITQHPPRSNPDTNSLELAEVLTWMAGLLATGVVGLFLAFLPVRSAPGRNLLMAAGLALLLSAPFYLMNLEMLWRHLTHELGEMAEVAERSRLHGFFFADPTLGFSMTALVLAGLAWLVWRGPKGSLPLLGLPMLANIAVNLALVLPDPRHYLPGYPLEVLVASSWLLALGRIRLVAWPLLAGLACWNAGIWLAGQTPMYLRPNDLEQTPGFRGCNPESLNGQFGSMMDRLAELTGPGSQSLAALVAPFPLSAQGLQAISASRGHTLILRGLEKHQDWFLRPAPNWAVTYANLVDSSRPAREIKKLADSPFPSLARSWLLVVGPAPLPLPPATELLGGLEAPHEIPAPVGFQARLYPMRPRLAGPPPPAGGPQQRP